MLKNKKSGFLFADFKQALFSKLLKNKHTGNTLTLKHNTIYVLPSKMGCGFLFVAVLNFILGINYQNNLILAMAYLMLVVLVLAILIGYSNVKGLTIHFKAKNNDYSPISPRLVFDISTDKFCQSFNVIYQKQILHHLDNIKDRTNITVSLPYKNRGSYPLKRIKLLSQYPFGLVSVWSYMQIEETVFVYPEQINPNKNNNLMVDDHNSNGDLKRANGIDEFDSLVDHQHGMGLQRVSWKHYAKTQQLMVKEFVNFASTPMTYDYSQLQGNAETRLSHLSYLITQAHLHDHAFALKLNSQLYSMAKGSEHFNACLMALSRFKVNTENQDADHS
ncbi:DUF58 domain-containing protein [Pseudoalteromonas sp. ZZD1]|uniref:DUF58 domain-containing protein n=1 Tax=Pseudoalteromonas sp. ZZD1 TaxID=3139395 RepID=UPI003BAB1063